MGRYAAFLGLIALGCVALAIEYSSSGPWAVFLLLWTAVSFGIVSAAYAGLGPGVFGKQAQGTFRLGNSLLLLPYLVLTGATWHLKIALSREPAWHEIAPKLWLGRRPRNAVEVPSGANMIVDMTSEFGEPASVRAGVVYRILPTLDYTAPPLNDLTALVAEIQTTRGSGVFIHCAVGHGRSALMAAAVLLASGEASSSSDAEEILRRARPYVHLNQGQRLRLEEFASALQEIKRL